MDEEQQKAWDGVVDSASKRLFGYAISVRQMDAILAKDAECRRLRDIIIDANVHDKSCGIDRGDECSCFHAELRRRK